MHTGVGAVDVAMRVGCCRCVLPTAYMHWICACTSIALTQISALLGCG
jgi:hypothetical protein